MDTKLAQLLKEAGITEYRYFEHPALTTREEYLEYIPDESGLLKTLFLKSKKTNRLFLVTCLTSRKVDLKGLHNELHLGNHDILRFAPEELLYNCLGAVKGATSPFSLINDKDKVVTFFMDKDILNNPNKTIFIHPLVNTATVEMKVSDLKKFFEYTNIIPELF